MIDCNKIKIDKGSSGEYVIPIQKYLKYFGYYSGTVDGICGYYTVEAIKKFQKANNLVVDGVFGKLSCQASWINGHDISSTTSEIKLNEWKDMMNRYNKYVEENKKEPNICYINKEYPYKYVTNAKYKDIKSRYDKWINEKKTEPNLVYVNVPKTTTTTTTSNSNQRVFTVTNLCERSGGDCLGQITAYHCGPHSIKQALRVLGITGYTEKTIGSYAGTTSSGTGHGGLETAIATIAKKEKVTLKVQWFNFSDLGSNREARFKKLGELMTTKNKAVFCHLLYRTKYGHYEGVKTINLNNSNTIIPNSLGNRCSSPAYCGYLETRSFGNQVSYMSGISQKSICVITKV